MTQQRILIACIGNIFMGDDGFGVEVARRMIGRPLPEGVTLKDFGIRSYDLAYAMLDPYELIILVDACSRGGDPGTVYLIEPETLEQAPAHPDAHSMNPVSVLHMVKSMGGPSGKVLIVGCEPADLGMDEEGKMGLTEHVAGAVEEAVKLIEKLVGEPIEATAQMR